MRIEERLGAGVAALLLGAWCGWSEPGPRRREHPPAASTGLVWPRREERRFEAKEAPRAALEPAPAGRFEPLSAPGVRARWELLSREARVKAAAPRGREEGFAQLLDRLRR
ncbi:MAG: hypothetical protein HY553_20765 [Elusimicrobia bacterium]|nr:hypothetical protein [Elusimicrobiota bacterium]